MPNRLPTSSLAGNPLKIGIVSAVYPCNASDPAVAWLRESVRQMTQNGHDVTIIAPAVNGLASHEVDGIPVHRFRYAPRVWETSSAVGGLARQLARPGRTPVRLACTHWGAKKAAQIAKQGSFDVIHLHGALPLTPVACAASEACDSALILSVYDTDLVMATRRRWARRMIHQAVAKADSVVAHTTDTADRTESLTSRKTLMMPFGSTIVPQRKFPVANSVPRILNTGRLIERNGIEYLIRAMPYLLAERPVRLVITGDGPQGKMLRSLAQLLNVDEHVDFLGDLPHEQLCDEYARCDVWVNPSVVDEEGYPEPHSVGVVEAYMHRKPVVASAAGGLPDAISHGHTGWLVPQRDELALARAVLDLINHPLRAQAFGEAGLKMAQDKFDWPLISSRIERVYRQARVQKSVSVVVDTLAEYAACPVSQISAA